MRRERHLYCISVVSSQWKIARLIQQFSLISFSVPVMTQAFTHVADLIARLWWSILGMGAGLQKDAESYFRACRKHNDEVPHRP